MASGVTVFSSVRPLRSTVTSRGCPGLSASFRSDDALFRSPARISDLIDTHGLGRYSFFERPPVAVHGDIERLSRAQRFLQFDLLPGGILHIIDARNAVADLESGLGGGCVLQ